MWECRETVAKEKMQVWHDTLGATGGFYLNAPIDTGAHYRVHYTPGDYTAQRELYARLTTPIVETKASKVKLLLRRVRRIITYIN